MPLGTLTSRLGLKKPGSSDAVTELRNNIGYNAAALDNAALYTSGTLAARPTSTAGSPGIAGRFYRATDDTTGGTGGTLYYDYGTGWILLPNSADPTLTGVTIDGPVVTTPSSTQNANYTLTNADHSLNPIDTSTSAVTVTLPAAPADGLHFEIFDATGGAATRNITIARNGKTINGATANLTIGVAYGAYKLVYTAAGGWVALPAGALSDSRLSQRPVSYSEGLLSALPAAGTQGRIYRATDDTHVSDLGSLWLDDGAAWVPIAGSKSSFTKRVGTVTVTSGAYASFSTPIKASGIVIPPGGVLEVSFAQHFYVSLGQGKIALFVGGSQVKDPAGATMEFSSSSLVGSEIVVFTSAPNGFNSLASSVTGYPQTLGTPLWITDPADPAGSTVDVEIKGLCGSGGTLTLDNPGQFRVRALRF